jgi:hypothetical protein
MIGVNMDVLFDTRLKPLEDLIKAKEFLIRKNPENY